MSDVPTRLAGGLVWYFDRGYGWLDPRGPGVRPVVYGEEYLAEYDRRAETDLGRRIVAARVRLLEETVGPPPFGPEAREPTVLDYGAGSGAFLRAAVARGYRARGYELNPWAAARLIEGGGFADPREERFDVVTMWDVLEHLEEPEVALECARDWLLLSVPAFTNAYQARASKHFKPGEHVWYFTWEGIRSFLGEMGFDWVRTDTRESDLGRESVGTFAFRRKEPHRGRE